MFNNILYHTEHDPYHNVAKISAKSILEWRNYQVTQFCEILSHFWRGT